MNQQRIRQVNSPQQNDIANSKTIVYWMSRDQRVSDNWALIAAIKEAKNKQKEIRVFFNLYSSTKQPQIRHYSFMLEGLKEVEKNLKNLGIPFDLRIGNIQKNIMEYIDTYKVSSIYTDFSPLKGTQNNIKKIAKKVDAAFFEVDTHNLIPVWITSNKQEYAARTIRPKIYKKLPEFLTDFPNLKSLLSEVPANSMGGSETDWNTCYEKVPISDEVKEISWIKPGELEAKKALKIFLNEKLAEYEEHRNDANARALSNLSPYLHYGQISAQRVVLELFKILGKQDLENSFFEELVVRRELADNFCYYNENYDNPKGFPDWAKKTLLEHEEDPREYLYSLEQLEFAQTQDELWNAAQREMLNKGKMHGYMRMYWAKKILQWTPNVGTAMKWAIYLNDKYELDGRDPNGYVGIAWSLGGVHDRPWFERKVFGTVRYMAESGCKKKFDVKKYMEHN